MGFCEYEPLVEVPHGVYSWSETEVGNVVDLPCFYPDLFAMGNVTYSVSRTCQSHRTWGVYSGGNCITLTTFKFQNLTRVSYSCSSLNKITTTMEL